MIPDPYSPKKKRPILKWAKRLLIAVVVLGLLGGTGFTLYMKIKYANFQPPMPAPAVIVSPVVKHGFSDRIEAIGTAEADQSAALMPTVTETVKSINIREGEFVPVGTVIVELSSDEERATLNEATKAFDRYDQLARIKIGSEARRDEEKARMSVARAQLDKRRIVAPFDGVLGIRRVSVGDMVSPSTVITTIDDLDPIQLQFSIPESYISILKPGLEIKATTEAYPGEMFTGRISAVDSRVNPETRAIVVKAEIPNSDYRLRPGLLMKSEVVKNRRESLAIPEEAIISSGDKKMVMTVGADNKVSEKPVTIGTRQAGFVEILGGIEEGEKVIIEGVQKARPGAEVKIAGEKNIRKTINDALEYAVPRKQDAFENMTVEEGSAPDIPPPEPEAQQGQ